MHCVLSTPSLYNSSSGSSTNNLGSTGCIDLNSIISSSSTSNNFSKSLSSGGSNSSDHNSPSPSSSISSNFSIPSPPSSSSTHQPGGSLLHERHHHQHQLLPVIPSPTSLSFSTHFIASDAVPTAATSSNNNINYCLKPITLLTPSGEEHVPNETLLPIECGPNSAILYLSRLCQGSKGQCIAFNGYWLTPNQFQNICGRETAKDWKRSIRHNGKSLKLLISKGVIRVHSPICDCGNQYRQHHGPKQKRQQLVQDSSFCMGTTTTTNGIAAESGEAMMKKSMELLTTSAAAAHHHNSFNSVQSTSDGFHIMRNININKNIDSTLGIDDHLTTTMQIIQDNINLSPKHRQQQEQSVSPNSNSSSNNNNNNVVVGSVKRETRLTSIIDHLISRTNEEYRASSNGSSSSCSPPELSDGSSSASITANSPSTTIKSSVTSAGDFMRGAIDLTSTITTSRPRANSDDDDEEDEDMAGGGRKSSSMSPTMELAETTNNLVSLAASTDSVDEDQQELQQQQKTGTQSLSQSSASSLPYTKKSKKSSRATIKNERQSPESIRSSPSPTNNNSSSTLLTNNSKQNSNNNTGSSGNSTELHHHSTTGGAPVPPPQSPPLKQMEQMMGRNYSDFMRSLAAKYNHSNPNDLYPSARSSSFTFDTRFLKPGAAAAAASLLAFQQQQQQAQDKITFPLIDMSSTQTLLSMVRSAALATATNSPTNSINSNANSNNNNNRTTPNGTSSHPSTPPMLNSLGNLKRPSSPLDLSSAGGSSSGLPSGLFNLNQAAAAAAASSSSLLSLPKKMKSSKRCGSSCSGCSNEAESISSWTIDDVCSFVGSIDLCAEYVQAFRDHSIDGTSLPLLTEDHLIQNMNMKLGPALKFKSVIAKKLGSCPICIHCLHCHLNSEAK